MTFSQDIRFAARLLAKDRWFTIIAVAILSVGIGATTTAFTMAYAVLVRPLPFPESDRLVWIGSYNTQLSNERAVDPRGSNRMSQFLDWQEHARSFEQVAAWNGAFAQSTYTLTGSGTPERIGGLDVSQALLPMLGARAMLGRLFRDGEDDVGAPPTIVLGHGFWQRRFGGRPEIVGKSITINGAPRTIVGVLTPEFPLASTFFVGTAIDVYLPLTRDPCNDNLGGYLTVLGRLRTGVTIEQARTDLAARQQVLAAEREFMRALAQTVTPLAEPVTRGARAPLLLLLGGVGCVLLIACANLANLLLIRASARRREMQLRTALGATMRRMLRQTLAESGLLAAIGCAAGIGLAAGLTRTLRAVSWLDLPRLPEVEVGGAALLFAVAICATTTLVFGSVPLLHVRGRDLIDALRPHGPVTTDRRAAYVQRLVLLAQVAFALMLTAAGALLFRSFIGLLRVDPGFKPDRVVAIRVDPSNRLAPPARLPFFNEVLGNVATLPGVESAALAINLPMDRNMLWDVAIPGRAVEAGADVASARIVSPGYFRTVGIPVIAGRDFDARDQLRNPSVVAINQTLARRLSGLGLAPLGATIVVSGRPREVIAVVSDVKHETLSGEAGPEFYIPHTQAPGWQAFDLVIRAAGDPLVMVPAIRETVWRVDWAQSLGAPVELQSLVDRTLRPHRLLSWLLGGFATAAVLLAALGVYGVVGYRVAQRTKEIAIRVALGAPRWRVMSTVLLDALPFIGLGLAAGVPLAFAAGTGVRGFLFGVSPRDPLTVALACAAVLLAALAAAYGPARRAGQVDAMAALRTD